MINQKTIWEKPASHETENSGFHFLHIGQKLSIAATDSACSFPPSPLFSLMSAWFREEISSQRESRYSQDCIPKSLNDYVILMTKNNFWVTSYLITAVAMIWSVICNACLQHPETSAFSSAEKSPEVVWKESHLLLKERRQIHSRLALQISRWMGNDPIIDRIKGCKRSVQLICLILAVASSRWLDNKKTNTEWHVSFANYVDLCVGVCVHTHIWHVNARARQRALEKAITVGSILCPNRIATWQLIFSASRGNSSTFDVLQEPITDTCTQAVKVRQKFFLVTCSFMMKYILFSPSQSLWEVKPVNEIKQ